MRNLENVQIKTGSQFETICPFPVGYIYQSYSSTSPASIYGGSWTNITGRFLYCNNSTDTGGENSHTLTINEMPRHAHSFVGRTESTNYGGGHCLWWYNNAYNWGATMSGSETGGSQSHNNMPAYQSCYAWRRTA